MATSKADFEKKIKDLETSLAKAASENSELKKSLEKQEEDWKTCLATAESKLGESEENLRNVTNRIELMVKSIWGMLDNLCISFFFLCSLTFVYL